MNEYSFDTKFAMSKGVVADTCMATIQEMIPGCCRVLKTNEMDDRSGIDYVASLRGGAEMFIDHKCREPGCSRFWNGEPEFALENFSVLPTLGNPQKVGWTLNEGSATHYTLHTFDPSDTLDCWILPFQLLRPAFRKNYHDWMGRFKVADQTSHRNGSRWESRCVFVPVSVVVAAINEQMKGRVKIQANVPNGIPPPTR